MPEETLPTPETVKPSKPKSSSDVVNQDADNAAAIERLEKKLEKQTNEIRDAIATLRAPTKVAPIKSEETISFRGVLTDLGILAPKES